LPLSEKIRVELFIPDLPDPVYGRLLEELGDELCYAFGGCSVITAVGKYRTTAGGILPDSVRILFSDTPFDWGKDRLIIEGYAEQLRHVVQQVLSSEEAILIAVFPVYHVD
jgi:hypothetical protein